MDEDALTEARLAREVATRRVDEAYAALKAASIRTKAHLQASERTQKEIARHMRVSVAQISKLASAAGNGRWTPLGIETYRALDDYTGGLFELVELRAELDQANHVLAQTRRRVELIEVEGSKTSLRGTAEGPVVAPPAGGNRVTNAAVGTVDGDEVEQVLIGEADVSQATSPANLTFDVSGAEELPYKSRLALERIAVEYAKQVLEEAGRLEAVDNRGKNEPMITPTHLADADMWLRRGYMQSAPPSGKSMRAKICTGLSYTIAIVCGVFINNIDKPWGSIGVSVLLILGAATYFLGEVKND